MQRLIDRIDWSTVLLIATYTLLVAGLAWHAGARRNLAMYDEGYRIGRRDQREVDKESPR